MIIYLKTGDRKPVWLGPRPAVYDRQGAIPDGWCDLCGAEVFGSGRCGRCTERKESV